MNMTLSEIPFKFSIKLFEMEYVNLRFAPRWNEIRQRREDRIKNAQQERNRLLGKRKLTRK